MTGECPEIKEFLESSVAEAGCLKEGVAGVEVRVEQGQIIRCC